MSLFIRILFSVLIPLSVSGCVSILDATHEGPIEPNYGERTFGAVIDDNRIETTITVNLRKASPELRASHINVVSFNGVVLLVGQVQSPEDRETAAQVAHAVQNVRQVHNELTVSGAISLLARTNDSWLTTKIKTKFLFNSQLDADRIKVVTEAGTVFLLGLVTREEADRAVEVARNTRGIQKIVRVFEYIENPGH
jgi:osmotically-inducible protein OsmY